MWNTYSPHQLIPPPKRGGFDLGLLAPPVSPTVIVKEKRKLNLLQFFLESWEVLEPETPLELNWHVEFLCELFEKVCQDGMGDVLVNIAPRHLKSRIISIAAPCWRWLENPYEKFLCLSYVSDLSTDLNYDRRRLIQSPWYQDLSGGMPLSFAKNRVSEFSNAYNGMMIAKGFDSGVTGRGGTFILVDDPNDPEKIESEVITERTIKRFRGLTVTRRNNINTPVFVIQQRTGEKDVSGWIKQNAADRYQIFVFPTIAEQYERHVMPVSGRVVERQPGELLHGKRYSREQIESDRKMLGSFMFGARHQQNPMPLTGGMIQRAWFENRYLVPPDRFEILVATWDTAQKKGEIAKNAAKGGRTTSPWAGQLYGIYRNEAYLLDAYCDHHDYPDGERMLLSLAQKWQLNRKPHVMLVEDKSTGSTLLQRLRTDHASYRINAIAVLPDEDKITRMAQESPALQVGRVRLPETAPWLPEWEQAIFGYPMSVLDPGDALSQFLGWFRERKVYSAGSVVGGQLPTIQS